MTDPMLRSLCGILALVFAVAAPAQGQDLSGVVNINFVTDFRLFVVMSAINAGGFDYEAGVSMHPVRRQVREKLKSLDPLLLQRLHDFYVAHHVADNAEREIARYTSLALLLSDPPRLEVTLPPKDIPPDVQEVLGFEQILPTFYAQARLEQLWLEVRPQYLAEIEKYKPVARQSIAQALQYLRTEARIVMDRQIFFIPDLISSHGIANSRIVGNLYYLVVGPAEPPEKNLRNIRHEYLHFLVDPLIEKNGLAIVQQQEILQLLSDRPGLLAKFRQDLKLLNTESLIEAVQLRIDRPADAREQLAQQYAAGNILIYHYYEKLQEFEKASGSFPEYLPSIIQAFDLKREQQRKEWYAAESEVRKTEQEEQAQRLKARTEWLRKLERANTLLQQRDFDAAEKALLAMKQQKPMDPAILFGLAQIELQRKNADSAESYFKAVIDQREAPSWMVAWSRLHLATVYMATDRLPEARAALQQVADLTGDLKGAREEAKRRLSGLPPP